jgi:hypothetical protein
MHDLRRGLGPKTCVQLGASMGERWAMGDGRWAMGDGRWARGEGRWAMGDEGSGRTYRFL